MMQVSAEWVLRPNDAKAPKDASEGGIAGVSEVCSKAFDFLPACICREHFNLLSDTLRHSWSKVPEITYSGDIAHQNLLI